MLVTGGPGTGKSTLAMQYVQAGLRRGERCLYVSTEQTPNELRDSFAPYDFDIEHERLSVATIHATPGRTIEDDEEMLTLDTLTDGTLEADGVGELDAARLEFGEFNAPFSARFVAEFLEQYAPRSRVVFDSVSGLAAVADDRQEYRRFVLDLVRLFTDEFGATTLFVAENTDTPGDDIVGTGDMLQFNTHGVIQLWRELVEGDFHRFVQVTKMRGVDHATKPFEVEFDHDGVHAHPVSRTPSGVFDDHEFVSTGVTGLDRLCGDGVIKGGTALLEHDGRANVDALVANIITETIRSDEAVVLLPPSNLQPQRLDRMIGERVGSVTDLLADDRLFVLDLAGSWQEMGPNVFGIQEHEQTLRRLFGGLKSLVAWKMRNIFETMNERRGDREAVAVVFTEAMLHEFDPSEVRQLYYWAKKNLFVSDDTVVFVQNPAVMQETLAEFFVYDAEQMLRTWMHDTGLQYIKLEKSPVGHLGSTQLVEHVDYPPYVRVQRPHGANN